VYLGVVIVFILSLIFFDMLCNDLEKIIILYVERLIIYITDIEEIILS